MRSKSRVDYALLFLGTLAQTQIRLIGSIGISELFMFLAAPIFFIQDGAKLKRDGFMPFLGLAVLASIGCILSSLHNGTSFPLAIRGFASTYSLFAVPVVLHRYLSRNLNGLKWFLVGLIISDLITVFAFQSGVEAAAAERYGGDASNSELFLLRHFWGIVQLVYNAWYLASPTWLSLVCMLLPTIYTICTTTTGRSMLLAVVVSVYMMLFVHRSVSRMVKLQKSIVTVAVVGLIAALVVASGYKYAAKNGYLSEKAQAKYLNQTRKGTGLKALIMAGRSEFFVGLSACLDEPFWGYGPWATDNNGLLEKFALAYGDEKDIQTLMEMRSQVSYGRMSLIPAHSFVIQFWLWFGALGIPLWIYIFYKLIVYLRKYISAVPQWFGYLALGAPSMIWNIMFSPYANRIYQCLTVTCLLLAIAVGKKKLSLTPEMYIELQNPKFT